MKIRLAATRDERLAVTMTGHDLRAVERGVEALPRDAVRLEVESVVDLVAPDDDGRIRCRVDPRVARAMLVALVVGATAGDVDLESWRALTRETGER